MSVAFGITFDCAHAGNLAEFWAAALGYEVQPPPPGFDTWKAWCEANEVEYDPGHMAAINDPEKKGARLLFIRVPEAKTAKNRMHIDIHVSAGPPAAPEERVPAIEAKTAELEALGAKRVGEIKQEFGAAWQVMTDPEGNEFCVV